jgi:hypothetical protein
MAKGIIFIPICENIKASNNSRQCQSCRYLKIMKLTNDRKANNLSFPIIVYDFLVLHLLPTNCKCRWLLLQLIALNEIHTR